MSGLIIGLINSGGSGTDLTGLGTDNNIPRWDGTDTLQDSGWSIDDSNVMTAGGELSMNGNDLVFTEAADHTSTPAAGGGYLWVRSDTPSSLIFTDDAGTDYDLTSYGTGTLSNVVEDTTPQLGGNLDLNSNDITGTGNISINNSANSGLTFGLGQARVTFDGGADSDTYIGNPGSFSNDTLDVYCGGTKVLDLSASELLMGARIDMANNYIQWAETTAPTGAANNAYVWAEDNATVTELKATCGTGGNEVVLCNENGDSHWGVDQKLLLDTDADSYIVAQVDDNIEIWTGGALRVDIGSANTIFSTPLTTQDYFQVQDEFMLSTEAVRSSTGTMSATDVCHPMDTTSAAFTATLTAIGTTQSKVCIVYDSGGNCGTNNLTIAPGAGDSINGAPTSLKIDQDYGAIWFVQVDTTTWAIIGGQGYTAS